ncbi:ImmA/IrrE family metallo-endopeptidase [Fructilactobacillus hinvesii]|uniref:ImmA/IrrE family metallo-endopeptidase n=1 Tax=Fructilactobacillus hinvesii TaxID=2940300 RepID=A0ABY5BWN6_9LACO|nr:ImmA/IrrE family metallo-endopeptidase [Fructilactobacillus hinvesii]USS88078.1 ImmA/IrrE family metallo-endopeptidase [Fructilactobacillus hinvesii]
MQEIINSLFNYALNHDIGVVYTDKLMPETKSFADIPTRSIVINANEPNQRQLPLIIAHEISHVVQCDTNDAQLNFSTVLKPHYEQKANIGAIDLLIPFYVEDKELDQINVDEFMQLFAIPSSLRDICITEMKKNIN